MLSLICCVPTWTERRDMPDFFHNQLVTVKKPDWVPDALNAPKFDTETTLYANVPCQRQDSWDMQVDAWGQMALKNVCLFFMPNVGPIPNGAFLVSEGQTLRVTGVDQRREFATLPTHYTIRAEIYQP